MNRQTQDTIVAQAKEERALMIKAFFAALFSRKSHVLARA